MGSSSKRAQRRQKAQESLEREASHSKQVKEKKVDSDTEEEEDHEVLFHPKTQESVRTPPSPNRVLEVPDCGIVGVTSMVKTLNDAIAAVSRDTAQIQQAYQQLRRDNLARYKAMADLTAMVKEYGSSPAATRPYGPPTPKMQTDVLDEDGNLHAADIGITWADNGWDENPSANRTRTGHIHAISGRKERGSRFFTHNRPTIFTGNGPETIPIIRPAADHLHRPAMEARQGYRPAAPIQRFNNKSLNWPAWFRHFRAVADVHGWSKEQRALQLVSYLDETAMNVTQELGDKDLYNYDVLVKLLGERFDPASRVSDSALVFTPDRDAIMRMQTHLLTPSLNCAGWAIRKVHRNYDKN